MDTRHLHEVDLDRTDRLPVLGAAISDADIADEAVQVEAPRKDAGRMDTVDLPTLHESVRSVEERIARQQAEYETLHRAYEKARNAEAAATARTETLAHDLADVRAALETERVRAVATEKMLADKSAAVESVHARIKAALREVERQQSEGLTLRDTVALRDAAIVQLQHSLAERDSQLSALQREHAKVVPALEERSSAVSRLEADLQAMRSERENMAAELAAARQAAATLGQRLAGGEADREVVRHELSAAKSQAEAYREVLRTHEWRRGFDENLFRELDAQVGVVQQDRGALETQREEWQQQLAALDAKLAARDEAIAKLKAAAVDDEALQARRDLKLQQTENARAVLAERIAAMEGEHGRLKTELASREAALADATASGTRAAQFSRELLEASEKAKAGLSEQLVQLKSEAQTREEELEVLMAHLQEARRPMESFHAESKRLSEELAAKSLVLEQQNEDNRALRTALDRTRVTLEEREFAIRRLERSEANNAEALERIQTSMQRLKSSSGGAATLGDSRAVPEVNAAASAGNAPAAAAPQAGAANAPVGAGADNVSGGGANVASSVPQAAAPADLVAELIRVDGEARKVHRLARRTRIGRAPGCDLQIESTSVSRHHALLILSPRDVIIEDLNSTNGVLVNGRKISRQQLNDGDLVTIGETQFRLKTGGA